MSKALSLLDMYVKVLEETLCKDCLKKPEVQELRKKLDKDSKKWFREAFIG